VRCTIHDCSHHTVCLQHGADQYVALLRDCFDLHTDSLIGTQNGFLLTYIFMAMFYATVWYVILAFLVCVTLIVLCPRFSRLALLLTIMRIGIERNHIRLLALILAAFVGLFGVLIAQMFWVCEPQRQRPANLPICVPGKQTAILQLVGQCARLCLYTVLRIDNSSL